MARATAPAGASARWTAKNEKSRGAGRKDIDNRLSGSAAFGRRKAYQSTLILSQ
jgi:hypothetical protein